LGENPQDKIKHSSLKTTAQLDLGGSIQIFGGSIQTTGGLPQIVGGSIQMAGGLP
jgi:hypothetical protein